MNTRLYSFFPVLITTLILGLTDKRELNPCYLSFTSASGLVAGEPGRLPEDAEKVRKVHTEKGEMDVTCVDGYRILYYNEKKAPFVNLKVELSEKGAYESDQRSLLDNLRYLIANSASMESKELIELEFNGYRIYGLSRSTIASGSTLGTFVMFPGNDVTVYFYFNNLRPEYRTFETAEDYKKLRDTFINAYTQHLGACHTK